MIARPIPASGLTLASPEAARQFSSAWDARRSTPPPEASAGGWFVITQPDHAALSGELARHWGNELFALPPSDEITTAIAHHDDGWLERDAAPRLDPRTRGPQNFLDLEPEDFATISRRSIERGRARSALGGIMVSWHFLKLAEARASVDPAFAALTVIQGFIHEQRRLQAEWRSLFGSLADEAGNEACQLLQFTDLLSICVCFGALDPTTLPQAFLARAGRHEKISLDRAENSTVALSPYPFDETPLSFEIQGRRLDRPTLHDQEDLAQAYAAARSERLRVEFRAA